MSDEDNGNTTEHRTRRKGAQSRVTPIDQYRGLHHHYLGDGVTPCEERRRSFHLQKQNVISHGSTSSCNSPNTSLDTAYDDYHREKPRTRRQSSLKDWVSNFFAKPFTAKDMEQREEVKTSKLPIRLKKTEYRQMIAQIVKEDFEMFQRHRPLLEHSLSAPESEVFAVREFPQSSQPPMKKNQSLDSHPGRVDVDFPRVNYRSPNMNLDYGASSLENNENSLIDDSSSGDPYDHRVRNVNKLKPKTEEEYQIKDEVDGRRMETPACQSGGRTPAISVDTSDDITTSTEETKAMPSHGTTSHHMNARTDYDYPTAKCAADDTYQSLEQSQEEEGGLHIDATPIAAVEKPGMPHLQTCLTSYIGDVKVPANMSEHRNGFQEEEEESVEDNSSPNSTTPDLECMEESSLSSPEDNLEQPIGERSALNGLLQEVEGLQYPSLSDSDADEWARVTVKAIRTMKTQVLMRVGSSMDSITSRQAVVGSSCDLEDIDDYEDERSPRWVETHAGTSVRQRRTPGGSETSSISSDPYTESDFDEGDAFTQYHHPPSPGEGQRFEFVFNTDRRSMSASRAEALGHPRRKIFRRFVSMNEPILCSELAVSPPPISEETGNKHSRSPTNPATLKDARKNKSSSATLPTSPLQDRPHCEQCPVNSSVLSSPDDDNPSIFVDRSKSVVPGPENRSKSPVRKDALAKSEDHLSSQSNGNEGSQYVPTDGSSTETTYHRYYHVFRQGELVTLIENCVDQLHTLESYYDNANWCVVAEKVQVWKI